MTRQNIVSRACPKGMGADASVVGAYSKRHAIAFGRKLSDNCFELIIYFVDMVGFDVLGINCAYGGNSSPPHSRLYVLNALKLGFANIGPCARIKRRVELPSF